jgi:hypothetical protein
LETVSEAEDQIEFLCPAGHRLHGPASLQGRPGQCPECGARFRIPSYEEVPEEEADEDEPELEIRLASGEVKADSDVHDADVAEVEAESSGSGYRLDLEDLPTAAATDSGRLQQQGNHPAAELLGKLWAQKPHGAQVEIQTSDGEKIVPARFLQALSRIGYGVFAVKEPDGTHTVIALAWPSVSRIVLRGMKALPDELGG